MRDIEVREQGIRLGQFLKLAGLADSGSDARELLDRGAVEVNSALERRRGRQLAAGDVIDVHGEQVRVTVPAAVPDAPESPNDRDGSVPDHL